MSDPGTDHEAFVPLGDVARGRLGEQCQYIAPLVAGTGRLPALGEGLRVRGTVADYHSMRIHRDDVEEFVSRVSAHRQAMRAS